MHTSATRLTACLFMLLALAACSKEETAAPTSHSPVTDRAPSTTFSLSGLPNLARYAGDDYSQSIPVTLANQMIGSYLSSVSYPSYDTALRSLTFDADTLRSYLQDTSIKTLRFYMAHTPAYIASNKDKYAGLNPGAITLIIAGLNDDDEVIRNKRGEVYEHMQNCPAVCPGNSSALIQ